MTNVQAVYENGVLRPKEPLELAEGETVELTVERSTRKVEPMSDEEYARRMKSVKSIQEWVELTKLLPTDDGDYDILKALDENRRRSGEIPRFAVGEANP